MYSAKMTVARARENNKKRQTSCKQQMMILPQTSSAMICAKLTKQQIYINTQQHHSKLCTQLTVARQGNLNNNVDCYHLSNNVYLKTKKLSACSANYARQAKRISNIGKTISSPLYYKHAALLTTLLSIALLSSIVFPLANCFLLEQLIQSNSNSPTTGNLAAIEQPSGANAAPAVSPLASAAASAVAAVAGDALSAALSPRQPIIDESKASQNNQSVQKSVVASLSSAVASAAAAGVAAAAHNALQAADGRAPSASLSTSGSSLQRSLAQAGARHLAMRALSESHNPEVPYNILHNMKKVEHAAPFYGEPGSASRPFVGKASDLRSSLSTTGSSSSVLSSSPLEAFGIKQLSSLIKSPTLRRVVENYGDFASELRSLLKPLLSPSSSSSPFSVLTSRKSVASSAGVAPASATPTKALSPFGGSRILRDISIPALLMLLMSAVPGEVSS